MSDGGTDKALLQRAVYYLLDQGAPIELVGDAQDQQFEIDGQPVTGSQVILKAYAIGMAEAGNQK